jgi:hypothetical protein
VSLDVLPPRVTGLRWLAFVLINNRNPNGVRGTSRGLHAAWVRNVPRQMRIFLYGLLLTFVAGGAFWLIHAEPVALVFFGYGGWMMAAAKFK